MNKQPAKVGNQIWNVPNVISAARLLLAILVFVLIPLEYYWAAFVIFVIAAATDWVDGWWARKFQQVTQLGRILDPFCDKIIICGTFILLAEAMYWFPWYMRITGWMAVIVVGRELLVTALRSFIESSGGDFSAKQAAKWKMVFQCCAAGGCLWMLAAGNGELNDNVPAWLSWTTVVFIWLALVFTIYSGLEYVFATAKFLGKSGKP